MAFSLTFLGFRNAGKWSTDVRRDPKEPDRGDHRHAALQPYSSPLFQSLTSQFRGVAPAGRVLGLILLAAVSGLTPK